MKQPQQSSFTWIAPYLSIFHQQKCTMCFFFWCVLPSYISEITWNAQFLLPISFWNDKSEKKRQEAISSQKKKSDFLFPVFCGCLENIAFWSPFWHIYIYIDTRVNSPKQIHHVPTITHPLFIHTSSVFFFAVPNRFKSLSSKPLAYKKNVQDRIFTHLHCFLWIEPNMTFEEAKKKIHSLHSTFVIAKSDTSVKWYEFNSFSFETFDTLQKRHWNSVCKDLV